MSARATAAILAESFQRNTCYFVTVGKVVGFELQISANKLTSGLLSPSRNWHVPPRFRSALNAAQDRNNL